MKLIFLLSQLAEGDISDFFVYKIVGKTTIPICLASVLLVLFPILFKKENFSRSPQTKSVVNAPTHVHRGPVIFNVDTTHEINLLLSLFQIFDPCEKDLDPKSSCFPVPFPVKEKKIMILVPYFGIFVFVCLEKITLLNSRKSVKDFSTQSPENSVVNEDDRKSCLIP